MLHVWIMYLYTFPPWICGIHVAIYSIHGDYMASSPYHLQSPLWDIPWNLYPTRKVGQRHSNFTASLLVPKSRRRFETFNVTKPQGVGKSVTGGVSGWRRWTGWGDETVKLMVGLGGTAGFGARNLLKNNYLVPIGSMYGIFSYIWFIFVVNVSKYTKHGSYGFGIHECCFWGWLFYSGW